MRLANCGNEDVDDDDDDDKRTKEQFPFLLLEKRYQPKCRTNVSSLKKKQQQQQQQWATRVIKERRKQGQSLGRGIRVIVQRDQQQQ